MDGRGRLAEPVTGALLRLVAGSVPAIQRFSDRLPFSAGRGRLHRWVRRVAIPLAVQGVPRGTGVAAFAVLMTATFGFGVVRGGHIDAVTAELSDARDALANVFGFRITSIALAGGRHLTREEILTTAGVTGRTSLLFLDAGAARARLKANPWIAEATVLKLYPGRLHVAITERQAYALWQKGGKVSVIASDGTVLQDYVSPRFAKLIMVVGDGAEARASEFLGLVERFPAVRKQVRAAVLVANRRWNLALHNGIEIKLPEENAEAALGTLVELDRDKKLLTRDIDIVDLRLPDRVTVRLTDDAYARRMESLKPKTKSKGGAA